MNILFMILLKRCVDLFNAVSNRHSKKKVESTSSSSLSVNDIDSLTELLNKHMQNLDKENGCGTSFNSEYWQIMLKLKRIKLSIRGETDE